MTNPVSQSAFLADFSCTGDRCEDTCCKGWNMQVDDTTRNRWKAEAPELVDSIHHGELDWVMKRDPKTDYCVKFSSGLCNIHKNHGSDFLNDACHFFPRSTRNLGDTTVMTAALSCPEVARLVLFSDKPLAHQPAEYERLLSTIKDYAPEEMQGDACLNTHQAFINATHDESTTAERIMARIISVTNSLHMLDQSSWSIAINFYLSNADVRLPAPTEAAADPFNLVHALVGLLSASPPVSRPRLEQTIEEIKQALDISIDPTSMFLKASSLSQSAWKTLEQRWETEWSDSMQPILKNWIAAQMALNLFPFAGTGSKLPDRITIIAVRFATMRLALMSLCYMHDGTPPEADIVRSVQSLSRFLDHLADPTFSLQVYDNAGWNKEARLRSLIGDK